MNMTDYQKKWYLANKEKIKEQAKLFKEANKEKIKEQNKLYREANPDKTKEWRKANVDHVKKYKAEYKQKNKENRNKIDKNRKQTDVLFKLTADIRRTIIGSFKKNGFTKKSKTFDILGCTFEDFKSHLESKFEPWMTWQNRGNWNGIPTTVNEAWDIDHIIPLDIATCEADILRLNHYTNLQPLCSYTNRNIKRNITGFTATLV